MYELGRKIADFAKQRLYTIQKTPLLLLGARDYKGDKVWYEQALLEALEKWIERTIEDTSKEFIYLYDAGATRAELEAHGLQNTVVKNLMELKEKERNSGHRFRVLPLISSHSGPIAVGDDWVALWILGEHDAACISLVNSQIADTLVEVLGPVGSRIISPECLLAELGLRARGN